MHDAGIMTIGHAEGIGGKYHHKEGQHDEQVGIGEESDELRDGVVRGHTGQHLLLVDPAHGHLITRHLHPYGVDSI